jgi:hypothetical protein
LTLGRIVVLPDAAFTDRVVDPVAENGLVDHARLSRSTGLIGPAQSVPT